MSGLRLADIVAPAMRRALLLPILGLSLSCSRGSTEPAAPVPSAEASAASAASVAVDDGLPSAANTEPLLADVPAIVVDHDHVLVDGAVVGDVKAILAVGRMQKIDGEFAALKNKREAWKAAHPGAPFPGVALLRMPRDTKAIVVKSVFQTAAFAGYPNLAFAVGTGSPRRTERIAADAQVPRLPAGTGSSSAEDKVLYVRLVPDKAVTLTWRQGDTVVSTKDVPWRDALERTGEGVRTAGLAAKLSEEWSAQRQHVDPQDRKLDQAIVHADDAAELRDVVAAIDALYETKRTLEGAQVPVFNATFSLLPASPSVVAPESKGQKVRVGPVTVNGSLPAEVVQRIVRQSHASFRSCYEAGLARSPALEGKVGVRFVIAKSGAVTTVADAASDLPDAAVKKCIFKVFSALSFPAPEAGTVTVVYTMKLTPG